MIDRRSLVLGLLASAFATSGAGAHHTKPKSSRKLKPRRVSFSGYEPGTIVIDPRNRLLYLVEEPGTARRYSVGVGRAGLAFRGNAIIGRKAKWPSWRPTKNMIRRQPRKYARYARGVPGGPSNPLGARALYLYRSGKDTLYRIHGTNRPSSIGRAVSNGCIRMLNAHVKDLYNRVAIGAPVVVL